MRFDFAFTMTIPVIDFRSHGLNLASHFVLLGIQQWILRCLDSESRVSLSGGSVTSLRVSVLPRSSSCFESTKDATAKAFSMQWEKVLSSSAVILCGLGFSLDWEWNAKKMQRWNSRDVSTEVNLPK